MLLFTEQELLLWNTSCFDLWAVEWEQRHWCPFALYLRGQNKFLDDILWVSDAEFQGL